MLTCLKCGVASGISSEVEVSRALTKGATGKAGNRAAKTLRITQSEDNRLNEYGGYWAYGCRNLGIKNLFARLPTYRPTYPLRLPTYLPRPRFAILWFSFDATGGPQYDMPLNAHLAPQTRQVDYLGCTCRKSRDAWPAGLDSRFNLDLSISRCARGLLMRLGALNTT
jgi:hypothetical protein